MWVALIQIIAMDDKHVCWIFFNKTSPLQWRQIIFGVALYFYSHYYAFISDIFIHPHPKHLAKSQNRRISRAEFFFDDALYFLESIFLRFRKVMCPCESILENIPQKSKGIKKISCEMAVFKKLKYGFENT